MNDLESSNKAVVAFNSLKKHLTHTVNLDENVILNVRSEALSHQMQEFYSDDQDSEIDLTFRIIHLENTAELNFFQTRSICGQVRLTTQLTLLVNDMPKECLTIDQFNADINSNFSDQNLSFQVCH